MKWAVRAAILSFVAWTALFASNHAVLVYRAGETCRYFTGFGVVAIQAKYVGSQNPYYRACSHWLPLYD